VEEPAGHRKAQGAPKNGLWMFMDMDVYGCLWMFMDVYGCLWMFMDVYGC
jgi:hypothetical protein